MKKVFNPARIATFIFLFSFTLFISCEKELSGNPVNDEFASQASSEADAESEFVFDEVFDNVMGVNNDVGMAGLGVFGQMNSSGSIGEPARINACPTITVTHTNAPDVFPVKIVMDFGTGCTNRDGRTRSGKIISVYSNRLIYPGAKAVTTFENYQVDSIKVQGTHIITNQSVISTPNTSITFIWKSVVEGAKLTKLNGNYTEWNSTKLITQVEGMSTPLVPLDDIFKITGSASGKVKRGDLLVAWKAETTEPLVKKFSCRWIVKGIIKVVRVNLNSNSQWVAVLNYGNGDCDKKAVITINGVSHEITLP